MPNGLVDNSSHERRLRLGFFTYLEGEKPQAEVYADALELFIAADELGFDVAWVAQHHFRHHGGLPSPFVFFATLAERASRIGVGTAVVTLPLESAIRVAEDAAVFEALHPGRLQLGLGTGFATQQILATFGRAGEDRRALYDTEIVRLTDALAGDPINDDGDLLNPPAPRLRARLWEGPSTPERAVEAGRRGSGLLLSRVAIGAGDRPTHELQIPLVDAYTESLPAGAAPRIGLSRTVYPSRQPDIARRDLIAGLEEMARTSSGQHTFPKAGGLDGLFAHHNIHTGSPEEVIASLQREPLLERTTDLICQVQPGLPSQAQTLEAMELIATEVAPALGWKPAWEMATSPA
jgi:alkanesulfonate monooxygenase SsuD/methylene tetrahydromethanopterin reductase-like flavin-dependent oxidoreductase (luciferase family)